MRLGRLLATAALALTVAAPAAARVPPQWRNCTEVNKHYPHGVGKIGAHDKTSGDAVTNFKRSTALYRTAVAANGGLDRDHDGIACERA